MNGWALYMSLRTDTKGLITSLDAPKYGFLKACSINKSGWEAQPLTKDMTGSPVRAGF